MLVMIQYRGESLWQNGNVLGLISPGTWISKHLLGGQYSLIHFTILKKFYMLSFDEHNSSI